MLISADKCPGSGVLVIAFLSGDGFREQLSIREISRRNGLSRNRKISLGYGRTTVQGRPSVRANPMLMPRRVWAGCAKDKLPLTGASGMARPVPETSRSPLRKPAE
jgi:hypothetical protein